MFFRENNQTHEQEFSVLLCAIFSAFDRDDNSEYVDAIELAAGFSLLCYGSKVHTLIDTCTHINIPHICIRHHHLQNIHIG